MKYIFTSNDTIKLQAGVFAKYKVSVKGGCGERGEGEFGGEGGFGQVKKFMLDGSKEHSLNIEFVNAAENGKSTQPLKYLGEIYHRGYKGGKSGDDVICTVTSGDNTEVVKALGGGGGGAGRIEDYVNYDPDQEHNLKLVNNACPGGANSEGILKYKCGTRFGGRGQDGDSDSTFDTFTRVFTSEYGYHNDYAEVVIEGVHG